MPMQSGPMHGVIQGQGAERVAVSVAPSIAQQLGFNVTYHLG